MRSEHRPEAHAYHGSCLLIQTSIHLRLFEYWFYVAPMLSVVPHCDPIKGRTVEDVVNLARKHGFVTLDVHRECVMESTEQKACMRVRVLAVCDNQGWNVHVCQCSQTFSELAPIDLRELHSPGWTLAERGYRSVISGQARYLPGGCLFGSCAVKHTSRCCAMRQTYAACAVIQAYTHAGRSVGDRQRAEMRQSHKGRPGSSP